MSACLHIIGPIRIDLSRGAARRAGLDYWDDLHLEFHESPAEFLDWLQGRTPWIVTKRGKVRYDRADYRDGDVLIFGNELRGLPDEWGEKWGHRSVFVPIIGRVRSYNLANTVSVVLAQASLSAGIYEMRDV